MTIPWPDGRPDTTVGNDSSAQMTQGFQVLTGQLNSLQRVIATQTAMMERTLNAAGRYQMAGQPQLRQDVLQNVAGAGGSLHGTRQTQVSGMGALSSMENLQAYGAQRLGQWIAGTPLYETPGASAGTPGGTPGGTPVGTPSSQQAPAGSGAAAAAATNNAAGAPGGTPAGTPSSQQAPGGSGARAASGRGAGAPPAGAPGNPMANLGGLPGYLWGGQNAAATPGAVRGTQALQQFGARVAMSGGGISGLASTLRHLPVVGTVMDAAESGANFYLSQREAGRVYQSVEGGTNLGAQTERLHQAAYQLSMFGQMPEGAAAQAFGAVTAMGYNQAANGEGQQMQNRQSALNFVSSNYTGTGMDVNQSLQILQTASQSAVVNLNNVGQVLKNLSDTAGQAGTNADQARQQFNSYFNTALQQGAGNGAANVAGGISSMQSSMGKEFSGVDFSGELSQSRQYLLSGMSGVSPSQLQYTQRNNPNQYNKMLAGQNMQILGQGGLMTPQMTSGLQGMISAAGGGNAIMSNPGLRDQVANQFLNKYQTSDNINENLWAQEISAMTGVQMNASQAFQWIVSQSAGDNEASHNASMPSVTGGSVSAKNTAGAATGKYGLAQAVNPTAQAGRAGGLGGVNPGKTWQQVLQGAGNKGAANAYLSQEGKSGQRSPVLEGLLQNTSQSDQVRVQTSSGARVMSITDAMKDYPNEMAAGQTEFYSSSGKTLGDTSALTHGLINSSINVSAEEKQKLGSNLGVTASKYAATHKGAQVTPAGGGQSVQIDLSSAAQQLLKLLPSNNDTAAATSQVPSNPYASAASR